MKGDFRDQLIQLLEWVGDGVNLDKNAHIIVDAYLEETGKEFVIRNSYLPLKEKHTMPFVDWLNKYVKGTVNEYVYEGVTHSSLEIVGKYEKWLKDNL